MKNYEDKDLAIVAMTILGLGALLTFSANGLDVVTNVICTIGGIVTGRALK